MELSFQPVGLWAILFEWKTIDDPNVHATKMLGIYSFIFSVVALIIGFIPLLGDSFSLAMANAIDALRAVCIR